MVEGLAKTGHYLSNSEPRCRLQQTKMHTKLELTRLWSKQKSSTEEEANAIGEDEVVTGGGRNHQLFREKLSESHKNVVQEQRSK